MSLDDKVRLIIIIIILGSYVALSVLVAKNTLHSIITARIAAMQGSRSQYPL